MTNLTHSILNPISSCNSATESSESTPASEDKEDICESFYKEKDDNESEGADNKDDIIETILQPLS